MQIFLSKVSLEKAKAIITFEGYKSMAQYIEHLCRQDVIREIQNRKKESMGALSLQLSKNARQRSSKRVPIQTEFQKITLNHSVGQAASALGRNDCGSFSNYLEGLIAEDFLRFKEDYSYLSPNDLCISSFFLD